MLENDYKSNSYILKKLYKTYNIVIKIVTIQTYF